MTEKKPKRPSNVFSYGEACLRALAKAGLGDKISLGGALGLLHYCQAFGASGTAWRNCRIWERNWRISAMIPTWRTCESN